MRCPTCSNLDTKVIDSRSADNGVATRRRRECSDCGGRFTTFERYETVATVVIKRSGERRPFDREKIVSGLNLAAKGRTSDPGLFECIAREIEESARLEGPEVTSDWIGRQVLDRLRPIDPIGALRFASVYKGFTDVSDFEKELSLIKRDDTNESELGSIS